MIYSIIRRTNILLLASLLIISCASRKNVVYFEDTGNFETLLEENKAVTKFKVDDLVSIHVSSINPEASAPFNLFRGPSEGTLRAEQVDYLIDEEGMIDFPVIGKIKIAGLSPEETRALLRDQLSEYLTDPIINIRLTNYTVTVLGQVNRPGTYPVNGERINIMEALGLAGDMGIKGRRENVLVIRDFDGTKVYTRIDLTSKEAFKSPVYYLTQNDVVYVEPNNSAITSANLDNRASIAISLLSLIITSTVLIITRS